VTDPAPPRNPTRATKVWLRQVIVGLTLICRSSYRGVVEFLRDLLARIIHEKCAIKAKPLISFTTMRMGCLMKFFAMKSLAQVFGGLGRFRAVR